MKRTKPKIALISPQVIGAKNQIRKSQPPLSIAYLAAVLEENGYDKILVIDAVVEDYDNVEILEDNTDFVKFGLSNEGIVEKIRKYEPDIVGISTLFSSQADCTYTLAREIKKIFPGIPIVLGGIHLTYMYEKIMGELESADFILTGEGEYAFLEFVEKFFKGDDYTQVPGLVWRSGSDIHSNPRPSFIKDLDRLPFPAWHLFNMEKYFKISMPHNPFVKSGRVGCVITSRGCPFNCYFCSSSNFFGHKFRAMSSSRVIEMIEYMVEKFRIEELQILDDNFTSDYQRVIEICEGIKHLQLRISLPNAIRADVPRNREKRLEMLKALHDSGCEQIGISIEHGDQEFLNKSIGKKLDLKEALVTRKLAQKAGLLVHAAFMMGFPFETEINRKRTIEYAKKLKADSYAFSLATPLPGTRMWDIVEENKLFLDSFNINRIVFVNVSINPHDISPEEIYKTIDKLNRELNEAAQKRRPEAREKYKLFKGKKAHGDRKYHYIEELD